MAPLEFYAVGRWRRFSDAQTEALRPHLVPEAFPPVGEYVKKPANLRRVRREVGTRRLHSGALATRYDFFLVTRAAFDRVRRME